MLCVFFDLETTGLALDSQIVDIGAIVGASSFSRLVQPTVPIPEDAIRIHKITDAMVKKDGLTFPTAFKEFVAFLKDRHNNKSEILLVAHNNFGYDMHILQNECKRYGLAFPKEWVVKWADSMYVLENVFMMDRRFLGLQTLAYDLVRKDYKQTHSALGDTQMLVDVVKAIRNQDLFYQSLYSLSK
jgi:DNA polymerase III epsilon subunit-like protein